MGAREVTKSDVVDPSAGIACASEGVSLATLGEDVDVAAVMAIVGCDQTDGRVQVMAISD